MPYTIANVKNKAKKSLTYEDTRAPIPHMRTPMDATALGLRRFISNILSGLDRQAKQKVRDPSQPVSKEYNIATVA